jgi:putative acyl-CoA dehydrogenase
VLADLAVESEAATALAFRIARSFDEAKSSESAALFSRIATPIGKYWLNKRVVNFVYEAMECHGGAGYIEESVLPRIYRQSPLNSIWEGSGNVICLDVMRALSRESETAAALIGELEAARGTNASLDRAIDEVKSLLRPGVINELNARRCVEKMAVTLQGSVLARTAPAAIADAFCATRFNGHAVYGSIDADIDSAAILSRATPQQ